MGSPHVGLGSLYPVPTSGAVAVCPGGRAAHWRQRWRWTLLCGEEAFALDRALASPGGFLAETSRPDTLYLWEKVGDPDDKSSQRTGSYRDSAVREGFL